MSRGWHYTVGLLMLLALPVFAAEWVMPSVGVPRFVVIISLLVTLVLLLTLNRYRQLNAQLHASLKVIDQHVLSLEMDLEGRVTFVSHALSNHTGHSRQRLADSSAAVFWPRDQLAFYQDKLQLVLTTRKIWRGEVGQLKAYGESFLADLTIIPKIDHRGSLVGVTEIRRDITDSKRLEQLSVTDELTGLANRRSFNLQLKQELERAARHRTTLCLAIVDVDHFKRFNDSYGHQAGDKALQQLGQVLASSMRRASDFSFRLGGEEFGVLFSPANGQDARLYLEKIRQAVTDLAIPHQGNAPSYQLTLSIGYSLVSNSQRLTAEQVYAQADKYLYRAKSQGRNRVVGGSVNVHEDSQISSSPIPATIDPLAGKVI